MTLASTTPTPGNKLLELAGPSPTCSRTALATAAQILPGAACSAMCGALPSPPTSQVYSVYGY
ncbi:hypothetical protein GQ53DRAFT_755609 [Thozetella sp. PMI_491]|nr:hypothetical protein GQ53DRAFT_755609 [Thozetella sp. PMI_491]